MKIVATSPASHATDESSLVTVLWCILPDVVCHIHLWYRLIGPGWPGQKAKLINPNFNDQFCCNEMTINGVKCRMVFKSVDYQQIYLKILDSSSGLIKPTGNWLRACWTAGLVDKYWHPCMYRLRFDLCRFLSRPWQGGEDLVVLVWGGSFWWWTVWAP